MQPRLLKDAFGWGILLWLVGYVLGLVLFAFVPPHLIGWVIMPFGTAMTLWIAFKKVTVDRMGSFTLTVHPEGGDVEAWFSPGEAQPLVIYNANEPLPMAKKFVAGKEDTATGTCDWGGHHVVVFNRGPATVKVRCKLVVVENPPKS